MIASLALPEPLLPSLSTTLRRCPVTVGSLAPVLALTAVTLFAAPPAEPAGQLAGR